jgi:hypothetical protein
MGQAEQMARKVHTIKEGEHLSAVAARYGFMSFVPIWNADENAHLREVREDPHQLLPGDQLVIPEKHPVEYMRKVDDLHPFVVYVDKLKLRVKVLDLYGKPRTGVSCQLTAGGTPRDLVTDGDGVLECSIPRSCTRAELVIDEVGYSLGVGELDPVCEPSGWMMRLENLGYLTPESGGDRADSEVAQAITDFQHDNDLAVSGEMDQPTMDRLVECHGC